MAPDCELPKSDTSVSFDFSQSHTVADTGYPEECWVAESLSFYDSTIEVQLPDGVQVGSHESARFHVVRYSGSKYLYRVLIEMSGPLSTDDTYNYAIELAQRYNLPTGNLDEWHAHAHANPRIHTGAGSDSVRTIDEQTTISLSTSPSFNDERPYVIYLNIVWGIEPLLSETPTNE